MTTAQLNKADKELNTKTPYKLVCPQSHLTPIRYTSLESALKALDVVKSKGYQAILSSNKNGFKVVAYSPKLTDKQERRR